MRWSLKELYPSFESEKFKKDYDKLGELISTINNWTEEALENYEQKEEKIAEFIDMAAEFQKTYSLLMTFARLNQSVDANNKKAGEYIERLENKNTEITVSYVKFQKWLGNIENLNDLIESTDKSIIKEHSFYLEEMAQKSQYLLSDKDVITNTIRDNQFVMPLVGFAEDFGKLLPDAVTDAVRATNDHPTFMNMLGLWYSEMPDEIGNAINALVAGDQGVDQFIQRVEDKAKRVRNDDSIPKYKY